MSGAATETLVTHWIDGHDGVRGARLAIHDPATGAVAREVLLGDAATVDAAAAVAAEAARGWGDTAVTSRVRVLRRWGELITDHRDDFVRIMGEEQGKVRADADGELMRGLETLDVACSAALLLKGEFSDNLATGVDAFSVRSPLGVCAAITPFNFPLMAPLYLSSIALACGNAVIVKPSERVPSASVLMARLAQEAGLPPGVLSVVQGDRAVVEAILDHPGIAAVSFIGSSPVARLVHARGSAAGKRVQAFGGAKNHMVVLPDADMAFAADAAVSAAFGSTGQRCMAISVVVAVGGCGDELVAAIRERAARVEVGPAAREDAQIGPLISAAAKQRVEAAIDGAAEAGATVVLDGRGHELAGGDGYFVGPTIVDDVTTTMDVYRDEVFGPVLSVVRVDTLDDALATIDANPYGNGAAIFTASGSAARTFQRRASAGMIGINVPIPIPNAVYSFGGWKDSRFGDLHMAGTEGFRFYTKQKVVTARWPEAPDGGVSLAFPGRDGGGR
jgi:malonate-semialdehyde dehydrogenase (acetylating)/methylmalonate-semialdehyde dehydrogenase